MQLTHSKHELKMQDTNAYVCRCVFAHFTLPLLPTHLTPIPIPKSCRCVYGWNSHQKVGLYSENSTKSGTGLPHFIRQEVANKMRKVAQNVAQCSDASQLIPYSRQIHSSFIVPEGGRAQ